MTSAKTLFPNTKAPRGWDSAYLFWTTHFNRGQVGFQVGGGEQSECVGGWHVMAASAELPVPPGVGLGSALQGEGFRVALRLKRSWDGGRRQGSRWRSGQGGAHMAQRRWSSAPLYSCFPLDQSGKLGQVMLSPQGPARAGTLPSRC